METSADPEHSRRRGSPSTCHGYEEAGGYQGLRKALKMTPAEVQELVKASNLRGRGGAGFPTGMKWSFVPMGDDAPRPKYLVANADEMEPGTFKDRLLLEGDPASAHRGDDHRRLRHPGRRRLHLPALGLPAGRSPTACSRRSPRPTSAGYLGKNILGSGYNLELHLHISAGRYMCGEETALLNALEGKRATPRGQAAVSADLAACWGKPTIVNNVETLCNVPHIVDNGRRLVQGPQPHRRRRDQALRRERPGRTPGLWELPMGTTMREILEEHAGGMRDGLRFAALLPGGASTDFLPTEHLDVPMDFDAVMKAGSRLGTGTMIVLDDQTCPVGMVRNLRSSSPRSRAAGARPAARGCPGCSGYSQAIEDGTRAVPRTWSCWSVIPALLGRRAHLLCPGSRRDGAAAERAEVLPRDFERHIREQRCPWR